MILEFGAKNYRSFKEGVEISFELGKPGEKNVSHQDGISNILCLKGKNGSGKTNILSLLSFLQFVNVLSFDNKPNDIFTYSSYFYNDEPSEAYIIFKLNEITYEYELSFTAKEIISEALFCGRNKSKLLFKREYDQITEADVGFTELQHIKLRSNVGVINLAHQYEIKAIELIYNFFAGKIFCNADVFKITDDFNTLEQVTGYYKESPEMFKFCKDMLKKSDLGIKDITIEEKLNSEDKKVYFPFFHYKTASGLKRLTFLDQSSGTKKLYKSLFRYFGTLGEGGTAVIDELDLHIHPHLVPQIFELFEDKSINTKNAQLIFTSHLTEIIDSMGKYRTYIIEKEENESFAYRLDEIEAVPIRNDRPISPLYNKGLLGGVPRL
jgi:AAA15 family ATPase/GTPase